MDKISEIYEKFMSTEIKDTRNNGKIASFPYIEPAFIHDLCQQAILILKDDQPLCAMSSPCVVVGDLHGHFFDLTRIIKKHGSPKTTKYVFLGDYIDRGMFQFETIMLLLMLKVLFPHHVCLLSGNHEITKISANLPFVTILLQNRYSPETYAKFISVFREMPPACVIDGKTFCCHGGIGPDTTFQGFRNLIFPLKDNNKFVSPIQWSDPDEDGKGFKPSDRGKGYFFGEDVVTAFLERHGLKRIIRAHTFLEDGVREYWGGKVISVFSASNYYGGKKNMSGAVLIKNDVEYELERFESLPFINREVFTQQPMIRSNKASTRSGTISYKASTPDFKTAKKSVVKMNPPVAKPRQHPVFPRMHFLSLSVPPVNSSK